MRIDQLGEALHRRGLAEQVDGHHHPRVPGHRLCRSLRVQEKVLIVHISKHGYRACSHHGFGRRDERVGRHDHLVAAPDLARPEGEFERVRAVPNPNAVPHADHRGVRAFERRDARAAHVIARGEDAGKTLCDPFSDLAVLMPEVDQRDTADAHARHLMLQYTLLPPTIGCAPRPVMASAPGTSRAAV